MTGRVTREVGARWSVRSTDEYGQFVAHAERLGARIAPPRIVEHHDVFLETPGRFFLLAGAECRLRHRDGCWVLTMRGIPEAATGAVPPAERSWTVPGAETLDDALGVCRRTLLRTILGPRVPYPLVEMRCRKSVREIVLPDGSRGESRFADLDAHRNGSSADLRAIELVFLDGDREAFARFLREVEAATGLPAIEGSHYAVALREFGYGDRRPAAPGYSLRKTDPESVAARKIVCRSLQLLQRIEPAVRVGLDEAAVRRMRVATRRLRTALRLFRDFLPGDPLEIARRLRRLHRALGRARDLEVILEAIASHEAELDGIDGEGVRRYAADLEGRLEREREALRLELDAPRFLSAVEALREICTSEPAPLSEGERSAARAARRWVRKILGNVVRYDRRLRREVSFETLHRMRGAVKRLADVCGFVRRISPPELAGFLDATRRLQGALGRLQDAAVAIARLRADAGSATGAGGAAIAPALGRLADRIEKECEALHEGFLREWGTFRKRRNLRLADPTR